MSGTVKIARAIFDHGAFADEPFTEREAWIWLIMEAAWKPRKRRVGDYVVDVDRGQVAASVRFMAKAWSWSAPKVQRYLKRLENLAMIAPKTDTGVTVITICKYDDFQYQPQASDTDAIQMRYTSDTNLKKEVIREEGKKKEASVEASADVTPADDISQAVNAYNDAARQVGWPAVQKLSDKRRRALRARLTDAGGATGWEHALSKARSSKFLTGQSGSFMASFDFLTKSENFIKLMEGNYDDRTPGKPAQARSEFDAAHREYTRRLAAGEVYRGPDPSDPFAGG